MQVTFTPDAVQEIERKRQGEGVLKLAYDNEGCGCAVNGVPTLWLTGAPGDNDLTAEDSTLELWVDRKHEVYFEDRMIVDFQAKNHCFVLKSSGQIYNGQMRLVDKRGN